MKSMNIYLAGVGGQGIGLLAEVLAQSALRAGYRVRGCDTHGLAQRHGTVISHLRIGKELFAPRIPPGNADIIIGLERLETYRAILAMLKRGGTALYYDAVYQPIHVRMGEQTYPSNELLEEAVRGREGRVDRVFIDSLADPRMQNIALIGRFSAMRVIPGLTVEIVRQAMEPILPSALREANLEVFQTAANG